MSAMFDLPPSKELDSRQSAMSQQGSDGQIDPGSSRRKVTQRLNFMIPDALVDRIRMVQAETGAATITEVLKNALRLYIAAVLAHKRGETLVFRPADPKNPDRPVDIAAGIY